MNGIETDVLQQVLEGMKSQEGMSKATYRVQTDWNTGFKTSSRTVDRNVGGKTLPTPERVPLTFDVPKGLGGADSGPNILEVFLGVLGTCIAQTLVAKATARGIQIDNIKVDTEVDIDLRGFLGLDENVRPGAQEFRAKVHVDTKADKQAIQDLLEVVKKLSPSVDTLANGTRVKVELAD